jgi:hypothetical protein
MTQRLLLFIVEVYKCESDIGFKRCLQVVDYEGSKPM